MRDRDRASATARVASPTRVIGCWDRRCLRNCIRERRTRCRAAMLHCLSFSVAMCRAYQPAMNAAKPMANSRRMSISLLLLFLEISRQ